MSRTEILDFTINTFRYYLQMPKNLDLTINSLDITRTRLNYGFPAFGLLCFLLGFAYQIDERRETSRGAIVFFMHGRR